MLYIILKCLHTHKKNIATYFGDLEVNRIENGGMSKFTNIV